MRAGELYETSTGRLVKILAVGELAVFTFSGVIYTEAVAYQYVDSGETHMRRADNTHLWVKVAP